MDGLIYVNEYGISRTEFYYQDQIAYILSSNSYKNLLLFFHLKFDRNSEIQRFLQPKETQLLS